MSGNYDIKDYESLINQYVLNGISTNVGCLLVEKKEREITDDELEDFGNIPINRIDNIEEKDKWEEWLNE